MGVLWETLAALWNVGAQPPPQQVEESGLGQLWRLAGPNQDHHCSQSVLKWSLQLDPFW